MINWFPKATFYRRIQLIFLSFIIIPLILISISSYYLVRNEIKERFEQTNEQMLRVAAHDVGSLLDDIIFLTNVTSTDANLVQALLNLMNSNGLSSYEDYLNQKKVRDYVHFIESKTLKANAFVYYVNKSDFIIYQSAIESAGNLKNEWSQLKQKIDFSVFQNVQWLGVSGNHYIIARSIRTQNSHEVLGTLVVKIPIAFFNKLFPISKGTDVSVYDENAQQIFYFNQKSVFNPILTNETKVPHSPWIVKSELSNALVLGKLTDYVYLYIIFLLGSIFILSVISSRLLRSMLKPMDQLRRIVRKFGDGKYDERLPVKGEDEFAIVGRAFNRLLDEIGELIQKVESEQEEKKIIELQALFAQIRPHFLFNTLNSIKYNLVLNNDQQHSSQIDSLLRLLRNYMKVNTPHTLQEECSLIRDYLDIMNLRNGILIHLNLAIERIESLRIPRMILQPIIENSAVHAFTEDSSNPTITIQGFIQNNRIHIRITDNGLGMSDEKRIALQQSLEAKESDVETSDQSVGLRNVYQRLRISYGQQSRLLLHSEKEGGTAIEIIFPDLSFSVSVDA